MSLIEGPSPLPGPRPGRASTPTSHSLHSSPRPSPSKRHHNPSPHTSPLLGTAPSQDEVDRSPRLLRTKTSAQGEVAVRAPASALAKVHTTAADDGFVEPATSSTPPPEDEAEQTEMVGLGVGLKSDGVGGGGVFRAEENGMTAREAAANQSQKLREIEPEISSLLTRMCSQYQ